MNSNGWSSHGGECLHGRVCTCTGSCAVTSIVSCAGLGTPSVGRLRPLENVLLVQEPGGRVVKEAKGWQGRTSKSYLYCVVLAGHYIHATTGFPFATELKGDNHNCSCCYLWHCASNLFVFVVVHKAKNLYHNGIYIVYFSFQTFSEMTFWLSPPCVSPRPNRPFFKKK